MRQRSTFLLLAICAVTACTKSASAPSAEPPAPAAEPSKAIASSPSALPTTIDEAAFIAMHEHKTEKAPTSRGIDVEVGGQKMYLSLPPKETAPMAAVIVIHEWWGLNDNTRHWADRLAIEGYGALAVDLYRGGVTDQPEEAMKLMKAVDDARAHETIAAAYRFLRDDPRIKASKVGSIGWCFGGGWSLQTTLKNDIDAAVIYYGRLVEDPKVLTSINGAVLGIFGNLDQGIPPETVDRFDRALDDAKVEHTIFRYDANHAFANPSSVRYERASAEQAWGEVRSFFRTKLGR